MLRLTNNI